jgi:non-ribosomal peptide synthetase-like protein
MYSTLYLAPWYRALGAKLGKQAEVSTASFISPDLLTLGDGSFIADIVSLGAAQIQHGEIMVDQVVVGPHTFVGNSAVIPPGTKLGDNCLIGCLSVPPEAATMDPKGVENGTSWIGSPAMQLPHRSENTAFSIEQTYEPTKLLIALRLFIEFFRVVLPSAGFLSVAGAMFSYVSVMRDIISERWVLALFPVAYLAICLIFVSIVIAMKWIVVGRYRPLEQPLWSSFIWRTELITALHDFFCGPLLLESLRGTPFLAWYFRALGSKIGKRVFMDSVQISEFDLVQIDDDVIINSDATIQTHLFEDRVMKMSHVHIGEGCVIGAESLVLYDTHMLPVSKLGSLSLLMKGETLPAGTQWEGTPARSAG